MEEVVLEAKECKLLNVHLYLDRAEITREIPTGKSVNKITVTGLVDSLDSNTIRVKGNKFHKILEVSYHRERQDSSKTSQQVQLEEQREKIEKDINAKSGEIDRLKARKDLNKMLAENSFARVDKVPPMGLQEGRDLIDWHTKETIEIDEKVNDLVDAIDALKKDLVYLRTKKNPDVSTGGPPKGVYYCGKLIVQMESGAFSESGELPQSAPLILTYIVTNASWCPSYDVRISSTEEKKTMQLQYFAEVKQNTDEDWTDVDLQLSTSNPALRAKPKPLMSTIVRRHFPRYERNDLSKMMKKGFNSKNIMSAPAAPMQMQAMQAMPPQRSRIESFSSLESYNDDDGMLEEEADTAAAATARVSGSSSSLATNFVIPHKVTIESDNRAHKVTIADIILNPEIMHYAAPCTGSTSVYLQSKTKNESLFTLLESNKVNIFLDDTFVAVSDMKSCSPNANFFLYMGADQAVKCNRKPAEDKEVTAAGWVSTSRVKECSFLTSIHNTKSVPCKLLLADTIPKSKEDKVSVEQIKPTLKETQITSGGFDSMSGIASLNAKNLASERDCVFKDKEGGTILWLLNLKAGEKRQVVFFYRITHPDDMSVEVVEAN